MAAAALWMGSALQAATIIDYNLTGAPSSGPPATWPATSTASGITAQDLSRGAGITAAGLGNGFSADHWDTAAGSAASAATNNEYFQFGFSVNPGNIASLSQMTFSMRRSAVAAPQNFELQASLDGFATPGTVVNDFTYLGRSSGTAGTPALYSWMTTDTPGQGNGNPISPINLTATPLLQNIAPGSTVTFRLYGWGNGGGADTNTVALGRSTAPDGNGSGGPVITGTVTAIVPEPTSIALVGCVLIAGMTITRRR